jgi:CCR4-NOT transcription complex subunit 7/8
MIYERKCVDHDDAPWAWRKKSWFEGEEDGFVAVRIHLPHLPTMAAGPRIREVWTPNLEAEMRNIRALIDRYPYVAMVCECDTVLGVSDSHAAVKDTEFPGVVARPIGSFKTSSDYHYQTMRCNVDLLKIIQIGITLANDKGELPEEITTWQFNFHFSAKSVRAPTRIHPVLTADVRQ